VPVVRPVGEDGDAAHATSDGTGPVTSDAEGEPVPADGATTAAPVPLVVHVSGAVHRPGVVELSPGARVQEAVAAAGGLTGEADPDRLNLARPLNDGERVWVPVPGEEEPDLVGPETGPTPAAQPGEPAGGAAGPVVDLNAADQSALEELPGVGPVTAGRIVAWREEHGRFSSAEELLEVSGIGERTLEQLRPHLTW
jgi:competence protein ComEA